MQRAAPARPRPLGGARGAQDHPLTKAAPRAHDRYTLPTGVNTIPTYPTAGAARFPAPGRRATAARESAGAPPTTTRDARWPGGRPSCREDAATDVESISHLASPHASEPTPALSRDDQRTNSSRLSGVSLRYSPDSRAPRSLSARWRARRIQALSLRSYRRRVVPIAVAWSLHGVVSSRTTARRCFPFTPGTRTRAARHRRDARRLLGAAA